MATTKYNFSQFPLEKPLTQRFKELSINSLRQVRNNNFQLNQLNQQLIQQDFNGETCTDPLHFRRLPLPLTPRHQEITIAAVDTSSIKIGETRTGIIAAIRGATVWKQNRKYHYSRVGPFIFHITDENKSAVYSNLEESYFNGYGYTINRHVTPPLMQMPLRLANLLERWLQHMLIQNIYGGIILFDGSLTSGTIDAPTQRMRDILMAARKNRNTVLAFSKATSLRLNGYLITDRLPEHNSPYLLETTGLRFKPPIVPMGDVYVARLGKSNMAFRLDIDYEIPFIDRIEAVEKLLGNDILQQSYPETLRLAHILCTFTANEVLAMQHFTSRRHGIQIINRPDMHRLLFGSYGREGYA